MLKAFFENNPYVLKRFLVSVLHLNIEPEECILHFAKAEFPVSNYNEYKKTIDFNIEIDNKIFINLELNQSYFKDVKLRNYLYHSKMSSLNLKRGDKIKGLEEITNIQLNLNSREKNPDIGEDKIVLRSEITNNIYLENNIIYLRYLEYYKRLYYNEEKEKEESDYWLALLMSKNFKEFNDILSKLVDDNLREILVKDVIRLNLDDYMLTEEEIRTLDRAVKEATEKNIRIEMEQAREKGLAEGRAEGIKQGIEQNSIEMIKSMLENNIDIETISKISNKNIEEIKKIAKN